MNARIPALWLILLLTLPANSLAYSIGVGPAWLYPVLNRSSIINQTLYVSTDSNQTIYCGVGIAGEYSDWILLYNDSAIVNPKSQRDVTVRVTVPYDAPNGNYSGSILISVIGNPESSGFTGLSIIQSLRVKTRVEVLGAENKSYNVTLVSIPATIPKGASLPLEIRILNKGNVWVKPDIKASILSFGGSEIFSMQNDTIIVHSPGEETIVFGLPTEVMPGGDYWCRTSITSGGETLWTGMLPFKIIQNATKDLISGEIGSMEVDKTESKVGGSVRIIVGFKNTGTSPVNSTLKVKILSQSRQEKLQSGYKIVSPGEETTFTATYTPPSYGQYQVEGYIEYGRLKTPSMKQEFELSAPVEQVVKKETTYWIYVIIAVLILAGAFLLYMRFRGRGRKREGQIQDETSSPHPSDQI